MKGVGFVVILIFSFNVFTSPPAKKNSLKKVFITKAVVTNLKKVASYPTKILSKTYSTIDGQMSGIVEFFLVKLGQRFYKQCLKGKIEWKS
ncbi:hypothetical protein N9B72_00845 [Bacteriovoracaceae bacterium]|nr:hypothetical protein [Bacteriovoracaceae bacterium]